LPRQQTLRALIDWSYDQLGDAERTLFTRLSVFAGGFTLEAAEGVGAGGTIGHADVLDLLTSLVEKSLVELDAGGERYRLLETVRQYALEKLDASDEGGQARKRHLDYFLAFAKRVQPELYGNEQGLWLARLDLDRENILAAHAWCEHVEGGAELGLRLVSLVQLYWLPRGLIELGHRITVEALARPGAQLRDDPRRGALYAASQLAYFMGAFDKSRAYAEESVSIARDTGASMGAADSLLLLGYACDALGQGDRAQANFEESVALARSLQDKGRQSFALNALAGHHSEGGDLATAEPLFEESVALAREMGDRESVAIAQRRVRDRLPGAELDVQARAFP
jgi:tetratricopeptide (TPR) repeat protein